MITVTVADGIATWMLDRAPVNALSEGWGHAAAAELDRLAARDDWRVLHVRSSLTVFSAGADLGEFRARLDTPDGAERIVAGIEGIARVFDRIAALPQVSLAEIGGTAAGGGLELALACDLRIVAEDVMVGLPEARLGLIPSAGGTQRLTRICGPAVAARLILGAEMIDGACARDLGLAQWAPPRAELAATARAIAERIAALPAEAVAAAKSCIALAGSPGGDGFAREIAAMRSLTAARETRARLDAFFATNRGRRDPPRESR